MLMNIKDFKLNYLLINSLYELCYLNLMPIPIMFNQSNFTLITLHPFYFSMDNLSLLSVIY